jgi:actin-related protein
MSSKAIDYQPPLMIDIGSDKVKYAQPIMNPFAISQSLRKDKKNKQEISNKQTTRHDSEEINVNPDSIFDFNLFLDSFPSILGVIDPQEDTDTFNKLRKMYNINDFREILKIPELESIKKNKINYCMDYHYGSNDNKYNKFGYEPIWGGVVDDGWKRWKNLIERIGECQFSKYNFLNNQFSETPIVLTQHALPFSTLKSQVKKMYEIMFEDYKAPSILLCSQAMLNLISNNLSSGIVVDLGESCTHITPVKQGFTLYDSAVISNFISGRTVSSLMGIYMKSNKSLNAEKNPNQNENILNDLATSEALEIGLEEYLHSKFKKEKEVQCYLKNKNEKYDPDEYKYMDPNILMPKELSTFHYLYSFPEVYKWLFSSRNYQDDFSDYQLVNANFKTTINFIFDNKLNKKFNERDRLGTNTFSQFDNLQVLPYSAQSKDSLEKDILSRITTYLNKEELGRFRQLSMSHMVVSTFEKLLSQDILNAGKFVNIILTGGCMNSPNFASVILDDFMSLVKFSEHDVKFKYVKNYEVDQALNFYKGTNYLAKIDNLDSIMISKQDYFDFGADYLCYNYI